MGGLLRKNGRGEPHGARICIESALILERWAANQVVPLYSGLIDGLRRLSEEIEASANSCGRREGGMTYRNRITVAFVPGGIKSLADISEEIGVVQMALKHAGLSPDAVVSVGVIDRDAWSADVEWTTGELPPGAREIHRATVGELIGAKDG